MRSALESLKGVKKAAVALKTKRAVVVFLAGEVTIRQMKDAVKKAGYGVSSVSAVEEWKGSLKELEKMAARPSSPAVKKPEEGYKKIDAKTLAKWLEKKDFLLINVHLPYAGELPKTDLFIPFDKIKNNLLQLPKDKSRKIVVYCRGGHMSAIAAAALVSLGYKNVYDLSGGMRAWQRAGKKLIWKQRK